MSKCKLETLKKRSIVGHPYLNQTFMYSRTFCKGVVSTPVGGTIVDYFFSIVPGLNSDIVDRCTQLVEGTSLATCKLTHR